MLKPIGNVVLVIAFEKPTATASGIILTPSKIEESQIGEVIALGTQVTELIAIGDKAIFKKHSGTKVVNENEEYFIYYVDDILAIL